MWQRSNDRILSNAQLKKVNQMNVAKNNTDVFPERQQSTSRAIHALFDLSYSLYVTESYSETYAYPLIAYLHEGYRSERDLWNWFPAMSDQNYIGLGVRAPFPHPHGLPGQFEWKLRRPDASIAAVREAVQSVQYDWTIHPKRTYIFGEGDGAVVALQHLILQQSLSYDSIFTSGVICRSLPQGWTDWLPHIQEQLSGRVLFLDPIQDPDEQAAIDAFSEAGLEITFAHPSPEVTPPAVINNWIMAGINTAIF